MTVRRRIEEHLARFSGREKQIARLIIEKYPVSALGGIEELARQSAVSPPTVTRFVRRLGFDRFVDFQRAIRLEIQDAEVSPLALLQRQQAGDDRFAGSDDALIGDLAHSLDALRRPALAHSLDAAADILSNERRRIFLIGGRWSAMAAQYLAFQMTSLRGEVHAVLPQATGVVEDRIADFGKRDVLVVYDFRRYQPETIGFAEASAARGVGVILFTDPELSPVADVAGVIIPVPVATTSPLDTLAPAIAATDALLSRMIERLGSRVQKRMGMLEQLRRSAREPSANPKARR